MKQTVVSGVQPSGDLHIGNYLGAIKQFAELQNEYKTYFFIADLHALTESPEPEKLRDQTFKLAALYLACGLDPKKTTLFIQSQVPQHTELGWILNTLTPLGELQRMTQFKDKSDRHGVLAGILNYPTLMAADILLYHPDAVPVGEDQVQHLELTRTLVRKFNTNYGETFREPAVLLQKETARVMGLDDPTKKMSKSASPANRIEIMDSKEIIRKKIMSAVTDSGNEIKYELSGKPGISNLLTIYSAFSGVTIAKIEEKYIGKNYGAFKSELAEVVINALLPIQAKYKKLDKNRSSVLKILKEGSKKAGLVAEKTMKVVRNKIGLLKI